MDEVDVYISRSMKNMVASIPQQPGGRIRLLKTAALLGQEGLWQIRPLISMFFDSSTKEDPLSPFLQANLLYFSLPGIGHAAR
jgi:hypothetical protein